MAEASSGREALEHLAQHPVDLLICDWNMPGMTGPRCCRPYAPMQG
ncbi:response regulator transcription factor [Caldichromatium japonicum]